jgi:hypothetical protein
MQFLVGQNGPLDVAYGLRGEACDVIWAQTADPSADDETVLKTIRSREDWQGHFSVMGDTQIRMRSLPE